MTDHDHGDILRGILGGGAVGASLGIAAVAIPGVGPVAAAGAIEAAAFPEVIAIGATAGASANSFREGLKKIASAMRTPSTTPSASRAAACRSR